ncbi:hypothetical protein OAM14_00510 [Candidatus Pelagibacter sp.]|nr:hypothetical protein [Candidatus Pelagibacter sp.]
MTTKIIKKKSNYFRLDSGYKVAVKNKKYLLDILNPTSKNTKYYESPPEGKISGIQIGRIILQVHQIINLVNKLGYSFKDKTFLDIGCGNGMISRLISSLTQVKYSYGIDPFLDGEHQTSWPKHNQYKVFLKILNILKDKKYLKFANYYKLLKYENYSLKPDNQKIVHKKKYHYEFKQLSALNLHKLKTKVDIAYLKSIEHFSDWDKLFIKLKSSLNKKGIVIFKHRSFFSYLGAHRYSCIGIPWGHVLLNEKEYKRFVGKFHNNRKNQMIEFFYNGLNYPRSTVGDLVKFASKNDFKLKLIISEPPHYNEKSSKFIKDIKNFWEIIKKNYPKVSNEEVMSGMYHIVFEKLK